jgi:alanine-synthesizing transaminase
MFARRTAWSLRPNRLAQELDARRRHKLPVTDLTESNPTRCGFEYREDAIRQALADRGCLLYEPDPRGHPAGRRAVAAYYAERGVNVDEEQIILTSSTSEAYSYLLRLLADPGDSVLVPQPSYPLLDVLAQLNDVELVPYPLLYTDGGGWQLDQEALSARLGSRTRAIIVVHPNNPTGSYVGQGDLRFLIECCRRHQLALVADEVFLDYPVEASRGHAGTHAGISEVLTFTLSGLSKICALPQMKVAWIVVSGPDEAQREALARLEMIADSYLSVGTPQSLALPAFLDSRHAIQSQIRQRLTANLQALDKQLLGQPLVTRLRVEGGWYVVLRLPEMVEDEEWALTLLREDGVLLHPGHFYDFASGDCLVASLLPEPAAFLSGIERVINRVALISTLRSSHTVPRTGIVA